MIHQYASKYQDNNDLRTVLTKEINDAISQLQKSPAQPRHFEKAAALAQQYAYGAGVFAGKLSDASFSKVSRAVFAKQLQLRLAKPGSTHQGDITYLCGAAASIHTLLNFDPLNYLKLAVLLYETGTASVAGGDSISASPAMKQVSQLDSEGRVLRTDGDNGPMGIIDYIMLGALRYTENSVTKSPKFDPQEGVGQWGQQFTLPGEMDDFLEDYLGLDIKQYTYYLKDLAPSKIQEALKNGTRVILFIDHALREDTKKTQKAVKKGKLGKAWKKGWDIANYTGSHYVVVEPFSSFEITQSNGVERISFSYWDYGGRSTAVNVPTAQYHSSIKGSWLVDPKYG